MFLEALAECAMYIAGEEDCSHLCFECPFAQAVWASQMMGTSIVGKYSCSRSAGCFITLASYCSVYLTDGCHINRGLLEFSHGRCAQKGGGRGKALHCVVGIMAAMQQGIIPGKDGIVHNVEGFVSW